MNGISTITRQRDDFTWRTRQGVNGMAQVEEWGRRYESEGEENGIIHRQQLRPRDSCSLLENALLTGSQKV